MNPQDNPDSRRIEVFFCYGEDDELENVAFFDNGSGMGRDELKCYATVNYSQDARRTDLRSSTQVSFDYVVLDQRPNSLIFFS
jgi:hypothetical protein